MTLQTVDWAAFLQDNSDMPPDISFKVYERGSVLVQPMEGMENEMSRSFGAHKYFLAVVSPTFRRQFFGSLPEIRDMIIVEETSSKAFGTMLDFIYLRADNFAFPCGHFSCLFEVRNLGERFQIADLVAKTQVEISSKQLTPENLLEAAQSATNYKDLFSDIANQLMTRCQNFFRETYQTMDQLRNLLEDIQAKGLQIDTDIVMMLIMSSKPAICGGCKRITSECLNGEKVTNDNVMPGIKVVVNPTYDFVDDSDGVGIITRKDLTHAGGSDWGAYWFIRWANGVEGRSWRITNGGLFLFGCR